MKIANKTLFKFSLLAILTCTSGILLAQSTGRQDQPRRPPPQEALDACKSSSANQACSFTSPRGTVSGTCWAPEGKPLACKPTDAPSDNPSAAKQ